MVARICSADLTQTNGRLLSFQASMDLLLLGLHAHVQPARFLRVSARMPLHARINPGCPNLFR
jgi:hypothetical protein